MQRSRNSDARSMEIRTDFKELLELFISRDDLIANKRATGRAKDAADIEALGEK